MSQGSRGRVWSWALVVAAAGVLAWWWWGRAGEGNGPAGGVSAGEGRMAVRGRDRAAEAVDVRRALPATISGVVRDPQGQAVAGARVCALPGGQGLTRADVAPRCGVSRRDGSYQIEGLWPVRHRVHASAAGFVATVHSQGGREAIDLRAGEARRNVDVVLIGGGVEVFGVVRDLSGGAVEGAQVYASAGRVRGAGVAWTESRADGEFSLWVLPGATQVWASSEGYAQSVDEGVAPGHRFEVFLTPEAVLVGTALRADDGTPVAGAEVTVSRGDASTMSMSFGTGSTITDEHGKFRVEGLAAGAYKAWAGTDELTGAAAEQVVLGVGETATPIVISMHAAFVVDAEIVAAGGPGCVDGSVMLEDRVRERTAFGEVEADGRVRVERVLPGEYSVQLRCEGYVTAEQYPQVRVVDASVKGLRWEISRGRVIRGVVVDTRGKVAGGVGVDARMEGEAARRTGGRGSTDAAGRFEVSGLLPGTYRLTPRAREFAGGALAEGTSVQVPEDRDVEDVRLELAATGELRGTVRDEQGKPLTRVRVRLAAGGVTLDASAGDDGSFVFPAVAGGSYVLTASRGTAELRAPGREEDEGSGQAVEVREGATTTVQLVFAASFGTIRGVVRDEDGGALADAFVTARRESERAGAAAGAAMRERWVNTVDRPHLSDGDGQFTIEGLLPGRYTLLAQRRGGGEGTLEHVAIGDSVVLTIAAVGRISGRVVLRGGGAPEEFKVRLREPTTGFFRGDDCFRTDGAWGFAELPAGNYELEVSGAEGTQKMTVALAAGETRSDVRVELAGMTRVTGTVVDLEGAPVPGVEVLIRGDRSFRFGGDGRNVSDAAGRFEVERAPVGAAMLMALAREGGYSSPQMNVEIPAGGSHELPPLRMVKERLMRGETIGELGYRVREAAPGEALGGRRYVVSWVSARGPAAAAGLVVGDEIVAVDGQAVGGAGGYLYETLTRVSAGTTVRLGLGRGAVVAVVAATGE